MNTHGYFNTHMYPYSGYPRGYGTDTGMIFIQRGRHEYDTIRTNGYPLTSLGKTIIFIFLKRKIYWNKITKNLCKKSTI